MPLDLNLSPLPASSSSQDLLPGNGHSSNRVGAPPLRIDNPMPHRLPEGENATPLEVIGTTANDKLVIVMVGLPATGTYGSSFL